MLKPPRRIVDSPYLTTGTLFKGQHLWLELVRSPLADPPRVETRRLRPVLSSNKNSTYFNVTVPERLVPMIAPYIEGWDFNKTPSIGLHRLVAACARKRIQAGWQVHHLDHNHLDNRSSNLEPCPQGDHDAYHAVYLRLSETPAQLRLFEGFAAGLEGLYLRITYRALSEEEDLTVSAHVPPLAGGPGGVVVDPGVEGLAGGVGSDRAGALCNLREQELCREPKARQTSALGESDGWCFTGTTQTLNARRLRERGVPRLAAERGELLLRFLARQEGLTTVSALRARYAVNRWSTSTLEKTLYALVTAKVLRRQDRRYGLTVNAWEKEQS